MKAIRTSRALAAPVPFLGTAAIGTLVALSGTAWAFDTGPHFDITADVLRSEGFSPNAIKTVQCANFFVDFYEFIGNPQLKSALDPVCRMRVAPILVLADSQHFDDLDSTRAVARKWDEMVDMTRRTAEIGAKSGDVLGLIALLGMSLHNVQDFYAHSNWVDGPPMGPPLGQNALAKYGDHPTWLSMDRADRERLDVYTRNKKIGREHGEWDSGPKALNKDCVNRPHHNDAYICAYFATRQWVRLFQTFVNNPVVWNMMQQFSKSSFNPDRDWDYAFKISFYGGHWNGNGGFRALKEAYSKYAAATSPTLMFNAVINFTGVARSSMPCIDKQPSALRRKAQDLLLGWGKMLYNGPANPALPSPVPQSVQFLQLQVHSIDLTHGDDGFGGGEMDWFGYAKIGGQQFVTTLIDEHDHFNFVKPYAPWAFTKSVPTGQNTIGIEYEQWELDYGNNDLIDVNPVPGRNRLKLTYNPTSRQVSGDFGKSSFNAEGKGDGDRARINVSIDTLAGSCLK
jgi:hypothetical protein